MKTQTLLPALTAIMIVTGIMTGCKKDKDEKKPSCRIITITPSTGDAYNMTYNSDGRLATVSSGNTVTTFAYSGSTIVATITSSGTFSSKRIITTNANGMATNIRTEYDASGTNWYNDALDYNGTELIKTTSTSSSGGTPTVNMYTWSDGNLVSISGSTTTTLEYYTDKPAQSGDYLNIAQLIEGYEIYRTKNLIKSVFNGSDINSFTYDFGSDGTINSLTVTGPSAIVYSYQHQCD